MPLAETVRSREQFCLEAEPLAEVVALEGELYVVEMGRPHPYQPHLRDVRIQLLFEDLSALLSIGNEILEHLHTLRVLLILEDDHLHLLHGIVPPQKLDSPMQITEVEMGLLGHHIIYDELSMQGVLPVVVVDEVALLGILVVAFEDHVVELMRYLLQKDLCFLGGEESVVDVGLDVEDLVEEGVHVLLGVLDGLAPYVETQFLALSV